MTTENGIVINQDVLINFEDQEIRIWNLKEKTAYAITASELARLVDVAQREQDNPELGDQKYIDAGLFLERSNELSHWPWNAPSRLFHTFTSRTNIFEKLDINGFKKHHEQTIEQAKILIENKQHNLWEPIIDGEWIDLPRVDSTIQKTSISDVLYSRCTLREFYAKPIPIEVFGTLIFYSFGYFKEREVDVSSEYPALYSFRRASPSAGGMCATDVYIQIQNIENIDPGIYFYDPEFHRIGRVNKPIDSDMLCSLVDGQYAINNLPLGVWFVSRFDKSCIKYPDDRHYRTAFLETGHLSQTFLLMATAMGLSTWLTGLFHDTEVATLLKLPDDRMAVSSFAGAGYATGAVFNPTFVDTES